MPTTEQLVEEYNNGATCTFLAKKYDMNRRSIGVKLKMAGVKTKRGCKPDNIIKKTYNELYVLSTNGNKSTCQCSCGNIYIVRNDSLKSGHTKSCGCYNSNSRKRGNDIIPSSFWSTMRRNALERAISFNISIEELTELWNKQGGRCVYTDIELVISITNSDRRNKKQTASIDRIDSSIGYTKDNVQFVHKKINIMKQSMTEQEFIEFCNMVTYGPKNTKLVEKQ